MLPVVAVILPTTANVEPFQVSLLALEFPIENLYAELSYPKKNPVPLSNAVCPPFILPPLDKVIPL